MPIAVILHPPVEGVTDMDQKRIIERAITLLHAAVNDPNFLPSVRNAKYVRTGWKSTKQRRYALTPDQIADRILSGRERATPIDQQIDLKLQLQHTETGILGSTVLGRLPIKPGYWFVNACAHNDKAGPLAGHLIHEWLHVSGFFHKHKGPQDDVPYVVGRIVKSLLKGQFVEENDEQLWQVVEDTDCGCSDSEDFGDAEASDGVPDE